MEKEGKSRKARFGIAFGGFGIAFWRFGIAFFDFRCQKGASRVMIWEAFGIHFRLKSRTSPEKTPAEKHTEIDAEKVRKNTEKRAKNMLKVGPHSMGKR